MYGSSLTGYGVQGYSKDSAAIYGGSDHYGLYGHTTTGIGTYGQATEGYGVKGYATTGTAGYFQTPKQVGSPHTGYALRANGRVKLDRCAGVATIAAGTKSVTVEPGIELVGASAVVATLQGSAGSETTTVSRVLVNTTANRFTIYLTAKATQQVKVAWHVFG